MTDAVRANAIENGVDHTTDVQASPAHSGLPNSAPGLPESTDAAVATWLQLIDRYFQVNRVPADHPRRGPESTII